MGVLVMHVCRSVLYPVMDGTLKVLEFLKIEYLPRNLIYNHLITADEAES